MVLQYFKDVGQWLTVIIQLYRRWVISGLRPLHTTRIFTKIFLKKPSVKLLSIYKTVEKIVAVVKKSCSVYGR